MAFSLADGSKFEPFTDHEAKSTLREMVDNLQAIDDHFGESLEHRPLHKKRRRPTVCSGSEGQ